MNINRHNYEEYFLLYADKELSAEDQLHVELFAAEHPDLNAELEILLSATLPPDEQVSFTDKESLYRTTDTGSLVNMTNFESWFVQYADNELSNPEKAETENFVYNHPELQAEFELIQNLRLTPDTGIRFPDQKRLFRKTETTGRAVLVSLKFRLAVAAALLLMAGIFWLRQNKAGEISEPAIASIDPSPVQQKTRAGKPEATLQATTPEQEVAANNQATLAAQTETSATRGNQALDRSAETPVLLAQQLSKNKAADNNATDIKATDYTSTPGTTASLPQALVENTISSPAVSITDISASPDLVITQTVPLETDASPNLLFANNAAKEDIVYIPAKNIVRKTPLKGILRKAGRFIEKNNPLAGDRERGGVYTASVDTQ